jgi:methyltransferase
VIVMGWLVLAVALVAVQRLLELRVSRRNERRARRRGAVEYGAAHYPAMVALHALWLASMLAEGLLRGPEFPALWYVALVAFLIVQPLRYWAILSLGASWNVRVLVVPGERLSRRGPYRYLSHPNYLVVAVEIAALPLIFGAWITALVFTALNAAFLYVRIRTEERALRELSLQPSAGSLQREGNDGSSHR